MPAPSASRTRTRTRIKFCGITREADLHAAVAAGADAIGLVCVPASKRYVSPARAAELRALVPPKVSVVALLVNASTDTVRAIIAQVRPDVLQFHGDESPADCTQYQHAFWRALRVGAPGLATAAELVQACAQYGHATGCAGLLFDSYTPAYGGSGQAFDHALLRDLPHDLSQTHRTILAGGLTAAKVGAAIRSLHPWAVDVSSGVEAAPGIKSAEKMQAFVAAVRAADLSSS